MNILRLFILPFLLTAWLHGVEINGTIVQGSTKTYESILAKLKIDKQRSDEKTLQEALLYKLINLSKVSPPKKIVVKEPANEKEYRSLTIQYGNWLLTKSETLKSLSDLQKKIDAVADQLKNYSTQENNTTQTLTLQLQYAFYTKSKIFYRKKLSVYEEAIAKAPAIFAKALKIVRFDKEKTLKHLKKIEEDLKKTERHIQKMEVERERLNLLGRAEAVRKVNDSIRLLEQKKASLLNDKLLDLFIQFSIALQNRESDEAFALQKEMLTIVKNAYPQIVQEDMRRLFSTMENVQLGRAATIKGATIQEIKTVLDSLWQNANAPLFSINQTPISAFKLFMALIIFILGFIIGQFYKNSVKKITIKSGTITPSTQTLLANLGYYIIVVIAFFITLKVLGINLSSIALVAGALSVGIGFGLQNIVSNFVSGLILMFERSIKIGDYIQLDEDLRGHVSDIRMRSTTITTNDNIDVIVPNQDLIQNRVINWTMNDRIRRFKIPFGVAYGTDADKVVEVILEAVETSGFTDIYKDSYRHTRVIMTGMNDSSVDFQLFVWIRGREILYPRRTTSRFLMLIYKTLNVHGIEIPFPQRDLHIRSVDGEIPLVLKKEDFEEKPS